MTVQINPREIAAEALVAILKEEGYNTAVLRKKLRQNGAMPKKDRAFVTEVVNGCLRNLYYIDFVINNVSKLKTEKMKPWILAVLRTAVYQFFFMNVPENALCNEAVNLVKKRGLSKLAGFTNGVLRNIIRQKDTILLPKEWENPVEYLSLKYSHPQWLLKMWLHDKEYEFVKALCKENNTAADVTIVTNPLHSTNEELKRELEQEGICTKAGYHYDMALHLSKTSDMGRLDCFLQGKFHVQDESSVTAVTVLAPQKGDVILDMCAAPGGKSFLMAEKMDNEGSIYCCDVYEHKLELLEEGAKRLGIAIINTRLQNGSVYQPMFQNFFDKVLVDAPCSGLGLIRKKPDIRLKKTGKDIDSIVLLQRQILEQAAKYVKKGGILVYSTCTLCKKENEKNIEWFLEQYPNYKTEDITPFLPDSIHSETTKMGYITLYPHIHHTDGFFICRLKRKE